MSLVVALLWSAALASVGIEPAAVLAAASGKPASLGAPAVPLAFVTNAGQLDPRVHYYGRGYGYSVYFTQAEAVLALARRTDATGAEPSRVALALGFVGANAAARPEGAREQPAKINIFTGDDPAKWRSGLSMYRDVVYRDLWPGIDLVFSEASGRLKYELIVKPGGSVHAIRLAYRGADGLAVDAGGNLQVTTPLGVLTDERPTTYQVIDGRRVPVESRFVIAGDAATSYGFVTGAYDTSHALVIDRKSVV